MTSESPLDQYSKDFEEEPQKELKIEEKSALDEYSEELEKEEPEEDELEPEEDREALLERRRQEKQERKERREWIIAREKLEKEVLHQRLGDIEKSVTLMEQRQFDDQVRAAKKELYGAETMIVVNLRRADHRGVLKFIKSRDIAQERLRELDKQAQAKKNEGKKAADTVVNHYAKAWIAKHYWYDVNGRDEDSRIVLEIDTRLANEGYVPRTELYWKELTKRVKLNLPHRFMGEGDN